MDWRKVLNYALSLFSDEDGREWQAVVHTVTDIRVL
jgi:hypothetical protein